jgi:hypothetical protein
MTPLYTENEFKVARSRDFLKLKCKYCNNPFLKEKHFIQASLKDNKNRKYDFCSKNCQYKAKPNFPANSFLIKCEQCGKIFKKLLNQLKKTKHNFCSKSCSAKYFAPSKRNGKTFTCLFCKKPFYKTPCDFNRKKNFCSKQCYFLFTGRTGKQQLNCDECKLPISQYISIINRHKFHFCNASCRARYANRTWNKDAAKGNNKSEPEKILLEIIKRNYPNLNIICRDRHTLPQSLELDFYIPSKNLAIELNGPAHFIPIFGTEALEKTQDRDLLKLKYVQERKINLLIIDISKLKHKKDYYSFLKKIFTEKIQPLINK